MVLPTQQDRALWRKAIQTPEETTDEERRNILGLVDPKTQLSNCLEITEMSPDEFEKKVLENPESLTMEECRLIQHGYHIWDNSEALAANVVLTAATLRASSLGKLRNESMKVLIQKAADDGGKSCAWVERLIGRSVPLTAIDMQSSCGFVILRDARTDCMKVFTVFQDVVKIKTQSDQHILQNTFLLVTPEVVASFNGSSITPWIWAYDTTFDLKVLSETDTSTVFDGRLKVAATSIFTWFYAARKEEIYCMKRLWGCAQKQPDQIWDVATEMRRYHGPLVLLKKGTHWPFNTYEFRS
ncbi:uncharacterized protein Bfra_006059 [Botrytis fragariae]|uniref:Uncharacterized protein n=1 Tax=Botrytis fragariae TaxID=1964551 RepID=A0A8H6ARX8_9HELO|nr:uncharacterized protein Bfra_006059 [Botrytis fragariae]KAF5872696.1 hypothetical protein Bfra_006059 [Botrytis fragariae]